MNWTDKPPKEPGIYWYSPDLAEQEPQIVQVQKDLVKGESQGLKFYELRMVMEDMTNVPVTMIRGWWYGPLTPPYRWFKLNGPA